jgi:mannose-6-phosphate isomerase-like protein (cupin superfamily)
MNASGTKTLGRNKALCEALQSQLRNEDMAFDNRPTILTPEKCPGRYAGEVVSIPPGFFRIRAMGGIKTFCSTVLPNTSMIAFSQQSIDVVIKQHDSGENVSFNGINGVIVPQKTSCQINNVGEQPLFTVYGALDGSFVRNPIGFNLNAVKEYINKYGTSKIMVPNRPYGERIGVVNGGLFGEGADGKKEIVLGPHTYDFSAGNHLSPQSMHVHCQLHEIFVTFSGMRLFYPYKGEIFFLEAMKGEAVIVPPGLAHLTIMDGEEPTFVFKASLNGSVANDKRVLLSDEHVKGLSELLRQ